MNSAPLTTCNCQSLSLGHCARGPQLRWCAPTEVRTLTVTVLLVTISHLSLNHLSNFADLRCITHSQVSDAQESIDRARAFAREPNASAAKYLSATRTSVHRALCRRCKTQHTVFKRQYWPMSHANCRARRCHDR